MALTHQPDPYSLKHKPVVLLPYAEHDGEYASRTDCKYLSLGWAQYDARKLSMKSMRHTGDKWSRQSEELPLHRIIDLVILLSRTVEAVNRSSKVVRIPVGTLEHQPVELKFPIETQTETDWKALKAQMQDPALTSRLSVLIDTLNDLRSQGFI